MTALGRLPSRLRLAGVHLPSGALADVVVTDSAVVSVDSPAIGSKAPADDTTVDLRGFLLLPSLVEPHAHLDKALTWTAVGAPDGDLRAAISSWQEWSSTVTASDVRQRVLRSLRMLLANGCTAVRTHVDVADGPAPLQALDVVLEVRDELREALDLQVVAFALPSASDSLVAKALRRGADLLGGLAHLADDPIAEHERLFRAADRAGVGLDLHTDEQLDPTMLSVLDLARRARHRAPGEVTASHCCSLGALNAVDQAEVSGVLAQSGVGVVTLPQTNLYLQARGEGVNPPRGLTALGALRDAGVTVCAGGDNLQDPFNPMGRADPLETASLLVSAGHFDVDSAFDAVSHNARLVLGLPPAGPMLGAVPDLLAIRAATLAEAIATAPADRVVLRAGRVVSTSSVFTSTVLDDQDPNTHRRKGKPS